MSPLLRILTRAITSAGLAALGWSVIAQAQTPTVFNACVTPLTGLLYQPKEAGKCFLPSHHAISWTDGLGAILSGTTAGGDLDGTYPNPKVDGLRGRLIADVAPTTNQVLAWNGTAWAPATPTGGSSGAAGGALTGTYPNPGLADGAVTTAALANASVTEAKLAFDPATQVELDAATATATAADVTLQTNINTVSDGLNAYKTLLTNSGGTTNAPGNPLSWNQLKDVPAAVTSGGSGISGWQRVEKALVFEQGSNSEFSLATANCPTGKLAMAGGFNKSSTVDVFASFPVVNGSGWTILVSNTGVTDPSIYLTVYAVCANAAP